MDVVTPCSAVTMFPLLYQKVLLFLVSYTAMGIVDVELMQMKPL